MSGDDLFLCPVHLHGDFSPVPRFLPYLMNRIWNREINPAKVFDLALPLDEAATR
jgi:hypothetical protein